MSRRNISVGFGYFGRTDLGAALAVAHGADLGFAGAGDLDGAAVAGSGYAHVSIGRRLDIAGQALQSR